MFSNAAAQTTIDNGYAPIAPLKQGSYQGIVWGVAFLPKQEETFKDQTKIVDKLAVLIQTGKRRLDENGEPTQDGLNYDFSETVTISLGAKSNMMKNFGFLIDANQKHTVASLVQAIIGQQVTVITKIVEKVKDGKPVRYGRIDSLGAPSDEISVSLPEKKEVPQWVANKWPDCEIVFCDLKDDEGNFVTKSLGEFIRVKEEDAAVTKTSKASASAKKYTEL